MKTVLVRNKSIPSCCMRSINKSNVATEDMPKENDRLRCSHCDQEFRYITREKISAWETQGWRE